MKLSLFGPGDDDREETVQIDDDELVGKLRQTVDAHPDLTLEEALRQGIQHIVDHGPRQGGPAAG